MFRRLSLHLTAVHLFSFVESNDKLIYSGANNDDCVIWSAAGEPLHTFSSAIFRHSSAQMLADCIVASHNSSRTIFYSLTGSVLREHSMPSYNVATAVDEHRVVVVDSSGMGHVRCAFVVLICVESVPCVFMRFCADFRSVSVMFSVGLCLSISRAHAVTVAVRDAYVLSPVCLKFFCARLFLTLATVSVVYSCRCIKPRRRMMNAQPSLRAPVECSLLQSFATALLCSAIN